MTGSEWGLPPEEIVLHDDEIHLWRAVLDLPEELLVRLTATLSSDEQARASRFAAASHGNRYIAGRGILRVVLALYLQLEPGALEFCYGPFGKPALVADCGGDRIRFNLSHTHGLALIAVTTSREVGVDIERLDREVDVLSIADSFFTPGEAAVLRALPEDERTAAFFRGWTRKEAFIKARGTGFSLAPDRFEVSLAPGAPARLVRTLWEPEEAARWSLGEIDAGDGFQAAVAVEGAPCRIRYWQWPTPSGTTLLPLSPR